LIKDINDALPESTERIGEAKLRRLFDGVFWPAVEEAIADASKLECDQEPQAPRTPESKLDELLSLTCSLAADIQRLPEGRNPLTAVHKRRLPLLEESGQIQELNYEITRIRTDDLLQLATEIDCGAMCDAIFETLRERHGLSNDIIHELIEKHQYERQRFGGSGSTSDYYS
jgi:hypothetical protein